MSGAIQPLTGFPTLARSLHTPEPTQEGTSGRGRGNLLVYYCTRAEGGLAGYECYIVLFQGLHPKLATDSARCFVVR